MTTGIIFAVESDGRIYAATSKRADLMADRYQREQRDADDLARIQKANRDPRVLARVARRTIAGVIFTNTEDMAYALLTRLDRWARGRPVRYFDTEGLLGALDACKRYGLTVHGLPVSKAKGPRVSEKRRGVIERRTVADPIAPVGDELAYRLEQHALNPRLQQPGYITADINTEILIGGLARIRGVSVAQKEGARDFKGDAERAMIGAGRALDYSQPRVDTSGTTADMVEANGADARAWYAEAREMLGKVPLRLMAAERVIIDGDSIQETAVWLGIGNGGAARQRVRRLVLSACTDLARLYGHYRTDRRKRPRGSGARATIFTETPDGRAVIKDRA